MSDDSSGRRKKRLTLIASLEGLEKAEKSLLRLGFESQSSFAKAQRLSRSSVGIFFYNKNPIQLDTFKRICEGLELEWQDIAGITKESANTESKEKQANLSAFTEVGVESATTLVRQITVLDESSQKIKAEIKLRSDVDLLQNIQLIASILRRYGGSTIKIIDIQEGSIKLIVEGSHEDIDRLLLQIESGELTEIDGSPIELTQILSEGSEYEGSSKEKWHLIEEIINNPTIQRNLENIDLNDTDLSGANLSGANLSGVNLIEADLSAANLSGANLIGAYLIYTNLIEANLSGANLSGANLSNANLSGASLSGASLSGADLSDASLMDTNLSGADLSGADLSGAKLMDANLVNANLVGANLIYAELTGANVEGARFSGLNSGITENLK